MPDVSIKLLRGFLALVDEGAAGSKRRPSIPSRRGSAAGIFLGNLTTGTGPTCNRNRGNARAPKAVHHEAGHFSRMAASAAVDDATYAQADWHPRACKVGGGATDSATLPKLARFTFEQFGIVAAGIDAALKKEAALEEDECSTPTATQWSPGPSTTARSPASSRGSTATGSLSMRDHRHDDDDNRGGRWDDD